MVRDGRVHFQSSPLQHFFDCPYQFGARGFTTATDTAEDAAEVKIELQPGDVILAGTDGLWDNLPESEWLQMIPRSPNQIEQVYILQLTVANAPCADWPAKLLHDVEVLLGSQRPVLLCWLCVACQKFAGGLSYQALPSIAVWPCMLN